MQDLWLLKQDASIAATDPLLQALQLAPGVQAWTSMEGGLTYVYSKGQPDPIANAAPSAAAWHRLECLQELDGASAGQAAAYHYVVETDVLPEYEDDLNAWYAQEHLPGLASVPGTMRAARYVDTAGSPRYYACYDLASPDILGCPAWLAVRETAWSSRVRPAFRNTRRTMFRRP